MNSEINTEAQCGEEREEEGMKREMRAESREKRDERSEGTACSVRERQMNR